MNPSAPGLETILSEAVEIPSETDRRAYLDDACGDDATLRSRIDRLVADHFLAGNFLEQPPMCLPPFETATFNPSLEDPSTGGKIGPYKLLQQIGEGGMGTVWMAEQTEPIRRRVALKLIRVERGQSKTILARFEAERQAIALMDHPHIAKLLDAGTTNAGQPFFVMELIKGVSLTNYCDTHKLSVQERLGLFQQICSAIQHAHQKGIIHRDLKPSNILIESHDGKPVPKVIDFGLAKKYRDGKTYHHIPYKENKTLTGTARYASINSHLGIEHSRRDDLESIGYLLVYFSKRLLPWQKMKGASKQEKYHKIMEKKII